MLVIPDLKNNAIQGAGLLGQSDIPWGQANSSGIPPSQKSIKAE
jgi:hypothetical protein